MSDPVADILARLENVKQRGSQWEARCPAHDDRQASLSIARGSDGRALVKCFAGCTPEGITAALGIKLADLFPPSDHRGNGKQRKIVKTYDYTDRDGALLYQSVRYVPKNFRQRRPDGNGGWVWKMDGVQLVPYRLPELCEAAPSEWVLVAEGEKDVDNLVGLGFVATCNPMGAGKWRPEFSEYLRGRRVTILVDKDKPGRAHGQQVAKSLRGIALEVKIIELPGDVVKDASDWISAGGTADELRQIIDAAPVWTPALVGDDSNSTPDTWPDPLPLPAGLSPVMPFDYGLLPDALRGWVRDIAERMQCPPDYIASTAMIVAGSLIGRKVAIRPKRRDDWQVVPNLYGANVGRPALMKSPAMQEVLKYLRKLEVDAKAEYAKAMTEYEAAELVADAKKRVGKEAIKQAVKDGKDAEALAKGLARDADAAPTRQRYLVNDTTVEKLGVILSENGNGVLIFVDELASFLRTMDREGHEGDRGFYLTAWAGDSRYTYDRIGRGTLDIEAAIVTIVGSIQPGVLAEYLRGAVRGGAGDDGLMQRFQMAVWPDAPATWRNVDRYPDAEQKAAAYAAFGRLAELTPIIVGAERDSVARDALPFLRFDAAVQDEFDAWRSELETRLRSGDEHPALESHLAKYRSLIPSLAMIVHLLDGGVGPVNRAALVKAIGWAKYLETHARRLYGGVIDGPAVAARLLAGHIRKGDVFDLFAARDVYRHHWTGLDRDETESAIDVLVSLHWLDERVEQTPGKPKTRYAINPKLVITQTEQVPKVPKGAYGTNGTPSIENIPDFDGDGEGGGQ